MKTLDLGVNPPAPPVGKLPPITSKQEAGKTLQADTRSDLKEALAFAASGQVKATIETATLDDVNNVLERLRTGKVSGRVVLKIS